MSKRSACLAIVAGLWASGALAADVEVINPETYFPEGPLWHDDRLYYVEYSKHRVMRWDGETNEEVWVREACGPSAVVAARGGFLVHLLRQQRAGPDLAGLGDARELRRGPDGGAVAGAE